MTRQQHMVTEQEENIRIDKLLSTIIPDTSRSQIQTWIKNGYVVVNNEQVKRNYNCQRGDEINWNIPEVKPMELKAENIPLSVLYEDKDLIVVDKPRGMVVHPSAGHTKGTLVNALLYHCHDLSGINGVERPGIVHRIDKDTSGLLVVAKNDQAHVHLAEQLGNKTVERKYEAIVHGQIDHDHGMIDAPIGRDPKDRQKMGIVENGKQAITHFHVLRRYKEYTYIQCQLETGRTHQIRVHMRYINHPLVGDPKYGPRKTMDINGQALHAKILGFYHPRTKKWLQFETETPAYFQDVLQLIEKMY